MRTPQHLLARVDKTNNWFSVSDKDTGKEGKPTFTQMSQWRTILRRITCFIRLVDFLLMELLRRLVLVGIRTLAAQVKASCTYGDTVFLSLMETTEEV